MLTEPKYAVSVEPTSMRGYSLLILHKPNDPEWSPTLSQQMPTEVAEWVKGLAAIEAEFMRHLGRTQA